MADPIQTPTQQDDEQQQSLMPIGQPMFPVDPADRPNFALGAATRAPVNTASLIVRAAGQVSPNVRPTPAMAIPEKSPAVQPSAMLVPGAPQNGATPTSGIVGASQRNTPAAAALTPMASRPAARTPFPAAGAAPSVQPAMQMPTVDASGADVPFLMPPAEKSATAQLWDRAGRVQNTFGKILARTGAGILRGADLGAEALAPARAMLIPGSELNTMLKNRQAENHAMKVAELEQKPELAELQGEIRGQLQGQQEENAERRNAENIQSREDVAAQRDAAAERRTQEQIQGRQDIEANKRATNPFEAFAYGTPEERKSAQDFIAFEKKQGARYEHPDEIEQRYELYKRDPEAYKAMFGDRGAAQSSRDQAQATRMLNYFEKQRKAIQEDFTLDDDEKQRQLNEIDQLEQPYLDIAQPGGNVPAAPAAAKAGTRNAPRYKAGDEVTYKGKPMRVVNVRRDGKLELAPISGGAQ